MTGALRLLVSEMKGTAERFAVASTGIINNGVLTALNPDNLGGLKEYPLKNIMEDITGLNGSVINDAQQPHGQNIQFCRKKFVIWFL